MIEVKMPADIHAYRSKLILGFTTRQVISIAGTLITGIAVGSYGKEYIPEDILPWIVIGLVIPIVAWGFFYYKDMFFEDFLKAVIGHNLHPQKRVYEDAEYNIFCELNEEMAEIEIIQQRIDNGEIELNEWSEEI